MKGRFFHRTQANGFGKRARQGNARRPGSVRFSGAVRLALFLLATGLSLGLAARGRAQDNPVIGLDARHAFSDKSILATGEAALSIFGATLPGTSAWRALF